MLHPLDEIAQTLHTLPKGFDAGFAVAFSAEETTEHGDLADDFTNRRDRRGSVALTSKVCRNPICIQIARPPDAISLRVHTHRFSKVVAGKTAQR